MYSCLYLINLEQDDEERKVFKIGFANNIEQAFLDHLKFYGTEINLDTYVTFPTKELPAAHGKVTDYVAPYKLFAGRGKSISLSLSDYDDMKKFFSSVAKEHSGKIGSDDDVQMINDAAVIVHDQEQVVYVSPTPRRCWIL